MTLTEKIEQIVLPSLRKGLEIEEKATLGPWSFEQYNSLYQAPCVGANGIGKGTVFVAQCATDVECMGIKDAAFIAHARNEWRKQTEALILAIEWMMEVYRWSNGAQYESVEYQLQSIANLWPDTHEKIS